MLQLGRDEYEAMIRNAEVLAADSHGDKVLRLNDGNILKLFRLKRAWSSARFWPYARRFERNTRLLHALGFSTIEVIRIARVKAVKRDFVLYRELAGRTLREVLSDETLSQEEKNARLETFAGFLARLHHSGVLFRSIHFGNVLVQAKELGLIDVGDMRKRWIGSLSATQRVRNFRHMLRYAEDRKALIRFGARRFAALYAAEAARLDALNDLELETRVMAEFIARNCV